MVGRLGGQQARGKVLPGCRLRLRGPVQGRNLLPREVPRDHSDVALGGGMARLTAAIIGCGRIGVGYNWIKTKFPYTHADAYAALADRVELVALCEQNEERAKWAAARHRVPVVASDLEYVLDRVRPDIVSVTVNEAAQPSALSTLRGRVRGIWCEKPYLGETPFCPTSVNYIRRFDASHVPFAKREMPNAELIVIGRPDLTTACHFVDLCRYWRIPLDRLRWSPNQGPCSYLLRIDQETEVYF